MKKLFILFALLCAGFWAASAQEIISIYHKAGKPASGPQAQSSAQYPLYENMRYGDYKGLYDARSYVPRHGDPYDPFLAGVASYFIPGLGQTACGEVGRGIGFFLGTELMMAGTIVSITQTPGLLDYSYYGEQTVIRKPTAGDHLRNLTMFAGTFAVYLWNVLDAKNVARIKNMYYQDVYQGRYPGVLEESYSYRDVNPYMRYREYKNLYSTKGYRTRWGDPYNPISAGLAAAVFPGLGHCVAGEWGRGALFMGGYGLLMASFGTAADQLEEAGLDGNDEVLALPIAAMLGLYVWNICDAVRVAKVKNLYARDLRAQMSVPELSLEPYINSAPAAAGNQLVGGLALKMSF